MRDKFPTAARIFDDSAPFVERAFRGARFKRYAAVNLVLVVCTLLGGLWLALGSGSGARDFRESIGVEVPHWEREKFEFTSIQMGAEHHAQCVRERERLVASGARPINGADFSWMIREAEVVVWGALITPAPAQHADLAARVSRMVERHPLATTYEDRRHHGFSWDDPRAVQELTAIVDADLLPGVELYRSPLDIGGAVRVVGAVAGLVSILLLLVIGPLLSGAQIAQEAHENTLPPLLGTRLSPQALVRGLTAGGMSIAVFMAVPQLVIFLLAAVLRGSPLVAVMLVIATASAAAVLVMLSQLLGLGMGRRWTSGLAGITLCGGLGFAMFAGAGFGWNLTEFTSGMISLLPHAGPNYLLVETFFPSAVLGGTAVALTYVRVALAPLAFATIAIVVARALARRIANRTQPSITRGEGLLCAAVLVGLAVMAMPLHHADTQRHAAEVFFLSLGAVIFPLAGVLAGRVSIGDGPSTLRAVPLAALLGEFTAYVGIHAVVALCAVGFALEFSIIGLPLLAWALVVVALVAIRLVAAPASLFGALFAFFAVCAATLEFVFAAIAFESPRRTARLAMELFEVPALFWMIQLAVLIGVPFVLLRVLRRAPRQP